MPSARDVLNFVFDAANNALNVNIGDITPGTDATDLGKAEDAVHASGDTGVFVLSVRNDTLAALAGTDGDYAPLQVDANGGLYLAPLVAGSAAIGKLAANSGVDIGDVDVTSITAGETHVGNVGGECKRTVTVMSLHTDANVANDVLAATQVISACLRVNDGTGIIQTIVVQDDDDNGSAIDLVFMNANTSIGTESAEVDMADNDTILGTVEVAAGDYVDMIDSQHATKTNVGIGIKGATGTDDIYLGVVARNTSTYSASGITVSIFVLND